MRLAATASDVLGVSGRAMLAGLSGGTTDPVGLAELARGALRKKLPALREALAAHFRPPSLRGGAPRVWGGPRPVVGSGAGGVGGWFQATVLASTCTQCRYPRLRSASRNSQLLPKVYLLDPGRRHM